MFNWLSTRPGEAHKIVEYAIKRFIGGGNGKIALDLGCGFGNESILLASEGFYVVSIDPDIKSLQVLLNKIYGYNLYNRICLVPGALPDVLENPLLDREFDLILLINVLQHMERKVGAEVLNWMKDHTKHRGIHVVVAFTEGSGQCFKTLFRRGELSDVYKRWGWKILLESSGCLPKHRDSSHPEEELEHYYDVLVARKPLL